MTHDDAVEDTFEKLSTDECWRLLSTQQVGRIAVVVGHYPLVFPVNYAVVEKAIVFRTGVGEKLWAIHRSNVTFEVDELDTVARSGRELRYGSLPATCSYSRGARKRM